MSDDEKLQRCNAYFMRKMSLVGDEQSRFLGLAIAGEAGELANLIKKEWRDGATPERDAEIAEEIADILIYLQHLARARGVDVDAAISSKLAVLEQRWPEAFNHA